jgi:hypothetical protein
LQIHKGNIVTGTKYSRKEDLGTRMICCTQSKHDDWLSK